MHKPLLLALLLAFAAPALAAGPVPVTLSATGPAADAARAVVGREISSLDPSSLPNVLAAFVDVGDKDGPALFIQARDHLWCGSHGCTTWVYRHIGPNWQKALGVTVDEVAVLPGGHPADLVLDGQALWRWSGRAYAFLKRLP